MYFKSRVEAGKMLAEQLAPKYLNKKCAVVALSDGAVMVGAEIAVRLKSVLTMLLTAPITLPHETDVVATVNQDGEMTYNDLYSTGELEDLQSEFRNYIEQQRMQSIHEMNSLLGRGGLIRRDLLADHNVILVSDGLNSGFSLDAAAQFLKPIRIEKLIVATPLASVPAVDRMHILADEIYCLNVLPDYMNTDHYYETKDTPNHDAVINIIESVVENWEKVAAQPRANS
jgi:predicted phosphoribosyltransferase